MSHSLVALQEGGGGRLPAPGAKQPAALLILQQQGNGTTLLL